ncbi:hypothetical protein SAMN02745207_03404 [Clostridium grantii DSM 8605]|uniref:Zinc-or iron-chelating domain-containing protein n=1 Tax=Clostridium grantii DSM 8605 TaxID=1121316 RepID=A0A1M5X6T5_9CLOT|nr:YkgJ family cysteine cluster protein [Clostridium grantii]SHH95537.1 hypothetical protein SAMN02745207_03404 [Clostridium grantii DSM 8605]
MISPEKVKEYAEKVEKENYIFRTFLKGQDGQELDRIVNKLHEDLFNKMDCKKCLNCCKVIRPVLDNDDIERIAAIKELSKEEFISEYLEESEGELFLNACPCKFLGENGCTIYKDCPTVCKEYPFTHEEDIMGRLLNLINICKVCPVVYEIFEKLKVIYEKEFEEYKEEYSYFWNEEIDMPIKKEPKIGRNEPCLCGSGKKYKKCCGKTI